MAGDAFQAAAAVAAAARGQDYSISVTLPDIPLWVPAEAKAILDGLAMDTTRLALQDAAGYISDEAGKFADTGHLAQSFGADPATQTGGIQVSGTASVGSLHGRVFSSLPYAVVMDQGRRPGSPISRAGVDAIGLWAQRKLGLSDEQAEHAKWAIALNIVRHGFEGHGYFDLGVARAKPRIEQLFSILATQMAAGMTSKRDTRARDARGRFVKNG